MSEAALDVEDRLCHFSGLIIYRSEDLLGYSGSVGDIKDPRVNLGLITAACAWAS